jgi:predicted nucleic acid-binding protein
MSGNVNILADTNLIVYSLKGQRRFMRMLEKSNVCISIITEIELLSLPFENAAEEYLMRDFISNCFVFDLDQEIKNETIKIRRNTKLKMADAVIAATSIVNRLPLISADKIFYKIPNLNAIIL